MVRHHHVEEAAGAEGRDGQSDGGEAQVEALVQVGADEGEGAPEHAAFQRHDQDHRQRPGPFDDADHLADHRAGCALARPRDVGPGAHDGEQRAAGQDVDRGQHPEDRAPAQPVADRAAQRRSRHQAERLAGQEAGQGRLPLLVAHIVAHPGDGERDDRRAGHAGQEARQGEHAQRRRDCAQHAAQRRADAGDGDHRHLAVAVAERAVHQHEDAVGEQEGGGGDRGRADRDAEGGGKLHQQRVDHAHVGGRREGGDRQEHDGDRGGSSGRSGEGRGGAAGEGIGCGLTGSAP